MSKLNEILDGEHLSQMSRQTFNDLKEEFVDNDKRIKELEQRLKTIASHLESYSQIIEIPGIGLITATALIASIGNATSFENGRQLSAWLLPHQHSTLG